jgi:hypothetical protein
VTSGDLPTGELVALSSHHLHHCHEQNRPDRDPDHEQSQNGKSDTCGPRDASGGEGEYYSDDQHDSVLNEPSQYVRSVESGIRCVRLLGVPLSHASVSHEDFRADPVLWDTPFHRFLSEDDLIVLSLTASTCQDVPMVSSGSDDALSRRALLARGVVATSAIVLAACRGTASSSGTTSIPSKAGTLDDTSFDLTIDPNRTLLVSGTVGGTHAAASGPLHGSGATTIKGTLDGLGVLAHGTQADQVPTAGGYLTTTHLDTTVDSLGSSLVGEFSLNPDYTLRSGAISGGANGRGAAVGVDPVPEAAGSSVTINGMYGPTQVALTAGVPVGGPFGVDGKVDGHKVHFAVTPGHVPAGQDFPTLRVTGNYSGPADLFALIIGGIAYFGS